MNLLHSRFAQWALKWALSKTGALITTLATQAVALLVAKLHLADFMPADSLAVIVKTLTENSVQLGLGFQAIIYAKVVQWQMQGVQAAQVAANQSATESGENIHIREDGVAGNQFVKAIAQVADVPVQDVVEAVKPEKVAA